MNTDAFDGLLRAFAATPSRRTLVAISSGGLLAALFPRFGSDKATAKNKSKRQKRRKQRGRHKKRKQRNLPPPPPSPLTRPDATCSGVDDGELSGSDGNDRLAQTFTALASGPLVRADLLLRRGIGEFGDYVLRLSPVDGATYTLVLARPGGTFFNWLRGGDNPCAGAAFASFAQTEPFSEVTGADFIFTTFLTS